VNALINKKYNISREKEWRKWRANSAASSFLSCVRSGTFRLPTKHRNYLCSRKTAPTVLETETTAFRVSRENVMSALSDIFKSRTATDSEIVRIIETILDNRQRERTLTHPLFWLLTLSLHTFSAYKSTVLKVSHWHRKSITDATKASLSNFSYAILYPA